ncbi:MAG: DbpA RNA binding domain-containing protein [Spirochaetales bacterium]|nr:DbpA RNA binding domain-containing protein [Spirochaetales bacterium]
MRQSRFFIQLSEEEENAFFLSCLNNRKVRGILVLSDETVLSRYREVSRSVNIKQLYLINHGDLLKESRKISRGYPLIGAITDSIIDQIRRSQIDLSQFDTVIAPLNGKDDESHLNDVSFIISHMLNTQSIFIIGSQALEVPDHPLIKTSAVLKKSAILDKENHVAKIPENMINAMDELVKKTRSDNEPEKLSEYRKVFKKCVPFGFRGWVTAFLLKEYLSKDKSLKMPQLKNGITLFIGIGKNRKVYPKDLIHLFINTGKIERGHIGEIRILDNYAFVTIEKKSADRAIENLNGINYRGRNLTVNYAKQK